DVGEHASPNHSRASLKLIVEPGLYMLLRFQKAAGRGNYETGNQAFSKCLRFLTIRDLMESLNRQLVGWAAFYQYTDYTATMFRKVDRTVFWKLGYWLARKYRRSFRSLMRDHVRRPELERTMTWVLKGQNSRGRYGEVAL